MKKDINPKVLVLFVIRVCLWIVALVSTIYWMNYSNQLYKQGIVAPEEYSPLMRPVLYTCLAISVTAVCISFALHAWSVRIKKRDEGKM